MHLLPVTSLVKDMLANSLKVAHERAMSVFFSPRTITTDTFLQNIYKNVCVLQKLETLYTHFIETFLPLNMCRNLKQCVSNLPVNNMGDKLR